MAACLKFCHGAGRRLVAAMIREAGNWRFRGVLKWVWAAVGLGVFCHSVGAPGWLKPSAFVLAQAPSAAAQPAADREFLSRNCVACHNQRLKTAGLTLD